MASTTRRHCPIRMWSGLELEPATDAQLLASLDLDYPWAEIPNWMMANLGPMVARGDCHGRRVRSRAEIRT